MTIYSTLNASGIDVNSVFMLDTGTYPEYPAPPFIPGEIAIGTDGSEWVYGTSSLTLAAGSVVYFSTNPGSWSVAGVSNTQKGLLGTLLGVTGGATGSVVVPAPSGTQTGAYFWVQRAGNCPAVLASASLSANTAMHTSTTAGRVGPTGGVGTSATISGMVYASIASSAGAVAPAILNFPTIGAAD